MRLVASVMFLVVGLAAIFGATSAWFTDKSEDIVNDFTAGTLEIEVKEKVSWNQELGWVTSAQKENWNPGDCEWKKFKIENTGSKTAYIRGELEGKWQKKEGNQWVAWDLDGKDDPVTVKITSEYEGDWQIIKENGKTFFYYKGILSKDQFITLKVDICLDGPGADNDFQGKRYTLTARFEAIQTTNQAVDDVWGYWYDEDAGKWEEVSSE